MSAVFVDTRGAAKILDRGVRNTRRILREVYGVGDIWNGRSGRKLQYPVSRVEEIAEDWSRRQQRKLPWRYNPKYLHRRTIGGSIRWVCMDCGKPIKMGERYYRGVVRRAEALHADGCKE